MLLAPGPRLSSAQVLPLLPLHILKSFTSATDHDIHKARRHAIAPFFSKAKVAARQELIRRNVDKVCGRVSEFAATTTFNLGAIASAYVRDTANEFIVGKQYNELEQEDFGVDLSHASQGGGIMWRITKHIRWFGPTVRSIPIDWVMKSADKGTTAFLRYLQVSFTIWAVSNQPFCWRVLL